VAAIICAVFVVVPGASRPPLALPGCVCSMLAGLLVPLQRYIP
jgi:hypothetical protein